MKDFLLMLPTYIMVTLVFLIPFLNAVYCVVGITFFGLPRECWG